MAIFSPISVPIQSANSALRRSTRGICSTATPGSITW